MDTYTDFRILHNKIDDGYGREEEGLVHDVSQVNIPESHLEISHRQYELLCQQLDHCLLVTTMELKFIR